MGEVKSSSLPSSRHVECQGANIEKMINELSAKLIALSGQECEVEVDVRLRFPKKQSCNTNTIEPKKDETRSKQSSKMANEERKIVSTPKRILKPCSNKMHDFAFDVYSFATTDARNNNNQNVNRIPRRLSSPDILTFNGMCNDSNNLTSSKSRNHFTSNRSSVPSTLNSSFTATSLTNQMSPKTDAKFKWSRNN